MAAVQQQAFEASRETKDSNRYDMLQLVKPDTVSPELGNLVSLIISGEILQNPSQEVLQYLNQLNYSLENSNSTRPEMGVEEDDQFYFDKVQRRYWNIVKNLIRLQSDRLIQLRSLLVEHSLNRFVEEIDRLSEVINQDPEATQLLQVVSLPRTEVETGQLDPTEIHAIEKLEALVEMENKLIADSNRTPSLLNFRIGTDGYPITSHRTVADSITNEDIAMIYDRLNRKNILTEPKRWSKFTDLIFTKLIDSQDVNTQSMCTEIILLVGNLDQKLRMMTYINLSNVTNGVTVLPVQFEIVLTKYDIFKDPNFGLATKLSGLLLDIGMILTDDESQLEIKQGSTITAVKAYYENVANLVLYDESLYDFFIHTFEMIAYTVEQHSKEGELQPVLDFIDSLTD